MPRIRLKMDAYDRDAAQVYAPLDRKAKRWICCCTMHIDSIDLVFGPEIGSRLHDWGEMDVDVKSSPVDGDDE